MRLSYLLVRPVLPLDDPARTSIWRGVKRLRERIARELAAREPAPADAGDSDIGTNGKIEHERRVADEVNAKPFSHALIVGPMC